MSFATDVKRFCDKTKLGTDKVTRAVILEVATRLINRTPVDMYIADGGHLKRNWQLGVDSAPTTVIPGADPSGAEAMNEIASEDIVAGKKYYLVNNVKYMGIIEYGLYPDPVKVPTGRSEGGYSTQAPAGVVGITMAESASILQKATKGTNLK